MYSFLYLEPACCSMHALICMLLDLMQISQEPDKVVQYSHLSHFSTVCCDPHKGFSIVNEAEVDVLFPEFSCLFYDIEDVDILISDYSDFSKSSLYIWKVSDHVLLKPSLKGFEHYLANMWNGCNCVVVLMFFGIAILFFVVVVVEG